MKTGTLLDNRYTLGTLTSSDLYGDTYLAEDIQSEQPVWIQTIPDLVNNDDRLLADFRRNFNLLCTLNHPNIAKVLVIEFDATLAKHFLVMEYVEGVHLFEYRLNQQDEKVVLQDAIEICHQIADALDYCHRALLHRNIRPENITLTSEGVVKLWNFSLCPESILKIIRTNSMQHNPESHIRIQAYMAPEQFFGFPPPGPAVDRYALGVLFYELVSGRLPFEQTDHHALMHAVCNVAAPTVDGLGKRYNRTLTQALSKDPGNRFASASAFIKAMRFSLKKMITASIAVVALIGLSLALYIASSQTTSKKDIPPISSEVIPASSEVIPTSSKVIPPVSSKEIPPVSHKEIPPVSHKEIPPVSHKEIPPVSQIPPVSHKEIPPVSPKMRPTVSPLKNTVLLQIESQPSGAAVILNDRQLGLTPYTVGHVSPGAYHLLLEKQYYNPIDMMMDITQDTTVSLSLDPVAPNPTPLRQTDLPILAFPQPTLTMANPKHSNVKPHQKTPPNVGLKTTHKPQTLVQSEIQSLLELANHNIQNSRLTSPKGDNALEKLQAIQKLDPNNKEAKKGLERIVEAYLTLARQNRDSQPKIIHYLDLAEKTMPGNPTIQEARNTLTMPSDFLSFWRDPSSGLNFVGIPKGCFHMGSNEGDMDEKPPHQVCLNTFWLGTHEVTQKAWQHLLPDEKNPSKFQKGGNYPVDSVSLLDAQRFIKRLNSSGKEHFRLPTEAEWEYACRGGKKTPFYFGKTIHAGEANFDGDTIFEDGLKGRNVRSTLSVGSFPANAFGLFDMHGNLFEWVEDHYEKDYYKNSPVDNPMATGSEDDLHILRGGAWYSNPKNLRCSYRYRGRPEQINHGNGFRLVRINPH